MFMLLVLGVAPPATQPSALDVYPPTIRGRFNVTVDHFRYTEPTTRFGLRYFAYTAFAKEPNAPVLFFFGGEAALEDFYNATGGLFEMAQALSATVFMPEHRYYGYSLPFGTNHSFTSEGLAFLTIEQALADVADLLVALPSLLGCGHASAGRPTRCRVVLFGGSYGGMLAAWHRYKFPHLSLGAVASGAPVDFYPGVQESFLDATYNTYKEYGGAAGCESALRTAFEAASSATLSDLLAAGLRPCVALEEADIERFAFYAKGALSTIACVDYPYPTSFIGLLPANPVEAACSLLQPSATPLASLLSAVLLFVNGTRELRCLDLRQELVGASLSGLPRRPSPGSYHSRAAGTNMGVRSWNYQACTEILLEPLTSDGFGFYPPQDKTQFTEVVRNCAARFGVEPRPAWLPLTYGVGADLAKYGSNILFVENDKDPWHVGTASLPAKGGVGGSVRRVVFKGGAHHQEYRFTSQYDSAGVVAARLMETQAVREWLKEA